MTEQQRAYYYEMINRGRGFILLREGELAGIATFAIGDDDHKYLYNYESWTIMDDDPDGETAYIHQYLSNGILDKQNHITLGYFMQYLKSRFPNVKRIKWSRVDANYRKHGITEGVRVYVHCKNIK